MRRSTVAACWTMVTSSALALRFRGGELVVRCRERGFQAVALFHSLRENVVGGSGVRFETTRWRPGRARSTARREAKPRGGRFAADRASFRSTTRGSAMWRGSRTRPRNVLRCPQGRARVSPWRAPAASAAYRCSMAWAHVLGVDGVGVRLRPDVRQLRLQRHHLGLHRPGRRRGRHLGSRRTSATSCGAANTSNITPRSSAPFEVCLAEKSETCARVARDAHPRPATAHVG